MENNFKYYVEISIKEYKRRRYYSYIMQSDWFDTEKEALKWAEKIAYIDNELEVLLMGADWDFENDTYIDIDFIRNLKI